MKTPTQHQRMHEAAAAISGTSGERRRQAIADFLRAAMIALLVG